MSSQNKNEGKLRLSLVLKDFAHAIEALARLRENNLKKYARDNWTESIGTPDEPIFLEENLESIERHVGKLWKGEELDSENGDHHATAIMCRVCFILEYYYRKKEKKTFYQEINETIDVLLESEPKKTLYDWSEIPAIYNWIAKDMSGSVFQYVSKPEKEKYCWVNMHKHICCKKLDQKTDVPWQDSLEARPT